jgi:hypothetical protein
VHIIYYKHSFAYERLILLTLDTEREPLKIYVVVVLTTWYYSLYSLKWATQRERQKKNGYIKGTASERERKNPEDLSLTTWYYHVATRWTTKETTDFST